MSKTKYIMSGGLAFAEQKDMEKLSQYAKEGWHLKRFAFLGYMLEQSTPTEVIYSVDYRNLDDDNSEYFELFSVAGWTHITSSGNMHIFCAEPNTKPIYSDYETKVEKYKNLSQPMHMAAIPLSAITTLFWIITANTMGTLQTILYFLSIILTLLTIPTVLTTFAAYQKQWLIQGKNKYVTISKLVPIFALGGAVVTLFILEENIALIVAAAICGAILFPALIKMSLSVYYKVKKA